MAVPLVRWLRVAWRRFEAGNLSPAAPSRLACRTRRRDAREGSVHIVTIPEGWELREIEPLLERVLDVPAESLEVAVRDSELLTRVGATGPTLEGFLFPDTYFFPDGVCARAAVGEMVHEFEREWRPQWDDAARSLGMSRTEAVTLASIIEKEARLADERPLISAVYHNRLRRHMPLQADPTIQYALGHHVERITYKDLEIKSPYNTYRHRGSPPGPIGSPGVAKPRCRPRAGRSAVPLFRRCTGWASRVPNDVCRAHGRSPCAAPPGTAR